MDNLRLEVEELIHAIIAPHDESAVKDTAENYFNSIDSIRMIELIVGVENKFGIEFEDEDLSTAKDMKLDEFVEKVEKYLTIKQLK